MLRVKMDVKVIDHTLAYTTQRNLQRWEQQHIPYNPLEATCLYKGDLRLNFRNSRIPERASRDSDSVSFYTVAESHDGSNTLGLESRQLMSR